MLSGRHSQRSSTTIPTLPAQLRSAIPQCAQTCLATYIYQGYDDGSVCSDGNLSCLCSTYSSYGFTVGELALTCLQISDCESGRSPELEQTAYGICSAQSSAVQPTLSVLNPPATTPFSSPRTTSALPLATPQPESATTEIVTSTSSNLSQSPNPTSSVSAASTSSAATHGSTGLTSAQAIGVSIGAVGFVVLVVALAYIIACMRRRKFSKEADSRHPDEFVYDKPTHKSWFNFPDRRAAHGDFVEPHSESFFEKRQTAWPSQHAQSEYYHNREKATGARMSMSRESCRSNSSARTVSRLLPEKPSGIPPRPARPSTEFATVRTPATVFEEDGFSVVPRPVPSLPKNPRQPQYAHQFTKSPEMVQPSLSLDIPRQVSRSETIEAIGDFPSPRENLPRPFYQCSKATSSMNSFLNYYEGPDSGSPEDYYPYTPIDEHSQVRRPAPAAITITKPTFPPVAVRISTASDNSRRTSFESTDPDEPTPPDEVDEEEKRLSPVAESPIASIRYPKIPRGSNQAVPRSPPQPLYKPVEQKWQAPNVSQRGYRVEETPVTPGNQRVRRHGPSLSGSTLAAKRLGDHAAHSLERGLRISPSGTPPEERTQPQNGYANVVRNESPANWPLPSQEPLRSPLWEPKLTPRRMGGDLYLSVSVATPKRAHFSER